MLLLASSVCGLFKWRKFEPELILLAAGWYLRFSLSYRDAEELLAVRSLHADHVTVWRWVNVMPQKFSADCDCGSDRPTTAGGRMRSISGLRKVGIFIPGCRLHLCDDRLPSLG